MTDRLEHLEALLAAATPGPWERGDVWLRAGVNPERYGPGRCGYCVTLGAPVWKGRADINGTMMMAHQHRDPTPYGADHEISAPDGLVCGNYDVDTGGVVRAEDAALIVAARNALPDLLAVVRAARDAHDAGEIIVTDADTAHEEAHLAIPEYAALALRAALVNFQGDACPECNDTGEIRLGDEVSEDTGERLGEDVACLRCDADGGRP